MNDPENIEKPNYGCQGYDILYEKYGKNIKELDKNIAYNQREIEQLCYIPEEVKNKIEKKKSEYIAEIYMRCLNNFHNNQNNGKWKMPKTFISERCFCEKRKKETNMKNNHNHNNYNNSINYNTKKLHDCTCFSHGSISVNSVFNRLKKNRHSSNYLQIFRKQCNIEEDSTENKIDCVIVEETSPMEKILNCMEQKKEKQGIKHKRIKRETPTEAQTETPTKTPTLTPMPKQPVTSSTVKNSLVKENATSHESKKKQPSKEKENHYKMNNSLSQSSAVINPMNLTTRNTKAPLIDTTSTLSYNISSNGNLTNSMNIYSEKASASNGSTIIQKVAFTVAPIPLIVGSLFLLFLFIRKVMYERKYPGSQKQFLRNTCEEIEFREMNFRGREAEEWESGDDNSGIIESDDVRSQGTESEDIRSEDSKYQKIEYKVSKVNVIYEIHETQVKRHQMDNSNARNSERIKSESEMRKSSSFKHKRKLSKTKRRTLSLPLHFVNENNEDLKSLLKSKIIAESPL